MLVTGGASGIGAATVSMLEHRGAKVAVLDRTLGTDVRDAAAVAARVQAAADELGGLTGVVNNAGTGNLKPLEQYTDDEWALLIGVNLTGAFNVTRAAVPFLRASGGGSIVNVASLSGERPTRGEGPYSVAKAGMIALTKSAALELAPDIRVNTVSPGFVVTPLTEGVLGLDGMESLLVANTPLGRLGTADDVAEAICFLLSGASSYITGHNLVLDGGVALVHAQSDPMLKQLLEMIATVGP